MRLESARLAPPARLLIDVRVLTSTGAIDAAGFCGGMPVGRPVPVVARGPIPCLASV